MNKILTHCCKMVNLTWHVWTESEQVCPLHPLGQHILPLSHRSCEVHSSSTAVQSLFSTDGHVAIGGAEYKLCANWRD